MKLGFIGAGKVGKGFGVYLAKHDFRIEGYFSRSKESAEEAASLTHSKHYSDMMELIDACDLIFITTPDTVISVVADQIAGNMNNSSAAGLSKKTFVHMSGAHSSRILSSLETLGAQTASLHPIQSIADVDTAVKQLGTSVFSIEGTADAVNKLSVMLEQMQNTFFVIREDQKTLYHMAACVVSNYLVTLVDAGLSMYESIGIDRELAYKALYPLIRGTVENLKHMDTNEALTGPIARGDVNTVKAHLQAVSDERLEALYRFLGKETVELTRRKEGTDVSKLDELDKLLSDEVKS